LQKIQTEVGSNSLSSYNKYEACVVLVIFPLTFHFYRNVR